MCTNNYNLLSAFLIVIIANEYVLRVQASRTVEVNGVETILALEKETINLKCKTDMPMGYCGFIHPNGTRYSFSGTSLKAGQCFIKTRATKNDTGLWRCHIGAQSTGVELIQTFQVRVVKQLAAIQKNITALHNKPMTLDCVTTKGMIPLSYCRFEPPNGRTFSINSGVTPSNPILGRYFFPSNKSLDRGDCAVTIRKVKYEDVGSWTCGAGFEDGQEHIDFIKFEVEGFYTMSTASATGITFGAIGIAALLAVLGFVAWKRRRILGASRADIEEAETHELERLPAGSSPQLTPRPGRSFPELTVQPPTAPSSPSD